MKENIVLEKTKLNGLDNIVVKKFIKGLEGGRTLYVPADTDVVTSSESGGVTTTVETKIETPEVLKSGHVIIKLADGKYQALPIKTVITTVGTGTPTEVVSYDSLPDGAAYVGLLYKEILKKLPAASIMTWGIVNGTAMANATAFASIKSAFKSAVPFIDYQIDEEA